MTKGYLRTTWLLACFFLTSLALCQEAVTLRYAWVPGTSLSWTLEMKASGSGALTTPQGTTEMPMNVNVSMPLFLDVLEVPGEGIAKVRLSLGLIVTEISTPMGDVIRTETDLKTGRVTTRLREAVEVTELPEAARGLVVNSVEMVLDSRGQVKELRLPDEVRAAMSRAMQGLTAGAGDLSQWVGWLAPILPEGPVAPGATWELTTPLAGLAGIQALPQITTVYSYEGMEEINGVPCHKITAKSSAADIDLTLPAAWGMGVETRLEGFSFDSHLTSYLSSTDTQLLLLKGAVTQAGTIHAKGTLQQGGQQIPVDQTVRMDCLAVSIEARRD